MARYVYYNRNPDGGKENDCVTRAISLVSGISYSTIRRKLYHTSKLLDCEKLCVTCYKFLIEEVLMGKRVNCDGMYPAEFAETHPFGSYLLRMNGHIVACMRGTLYDIFDSRYMDLLTDAWELK